MALICACGKAALDGVRCRLGATHEDPPPRTVAQLKRWRDDIAAAGRGDEIPQEVHDAIAAGEQG